VATLLDTNILLRLLQVDHRQNAIAEEIQTLHELFRVLEGKPGVIREWEMLVSGSSLSGKLAHDAHLVATMRVHGVESVLTFNGTDFERFPGIAVIDPFDLRKRE
jgi:predicted nucleic acid-binding protein